MLTLFNIIVDYSQPYVEYSQHFVDYSQQILEPTRLRDHYNKKMNCKYPTFSGIAKTRCIANIIHELQKHDQLSQRFSTTNHDSCSARHSIIHFFFNSIVIIQIQCSLALNVHTPPIFCWISNFSTAARHTHARQTYPYIRVQVQPSTSMTCRLRLACANI